MRASPPDGPRRLDPILAIAALVAAAATASAQRQFDAPRRGLTASQANSRAIAVGDMDGDGDLDIVIGNYGSPSNIALNDGRRQFNEASTLPDRVRGIELVDFDGDGDLDVALARLGTNALYLNNGNGTFTDGSASLAPFRNEANRGIAAGDVDGDGDADIVFATSRQNRLYLNNGNGTFVDATSSGMPALPDTSSHSLLADVDGDGDLDQFVTNNGQNRLLLNNGSGVFVDVTANRLPPDSEFGLASDALDADGDGDVDVVVVGNASARLYLNDGTGTFTTGSSLAAVGLDVSAGDIDRDGDTDLTIATSRANLIYLNDGSGGFSASRELAPDQRVSASIALGDLDGDGDLDAAVGNGYSNAIANDLYVNDGSGLYSNVNPQPLPAVRANTTALALGDVDADGDVDIVFGNSGGFRTPPDNRLLLNDGRGKFTAGLAASFPPGTENTRAAAFGDVDGDGDLDLVLGNTGLNALLVNNGGGTFTDASTTNLPGVSTQTQAIQLGDVDGDGDLDLVEGNGTRNGAYQNRLYLNDGNGVFSPAPLPTRFDATNDITLGDLDGDGDLDILVANGGFYVLYGSRYPGEANAVLINDGSGSFADESATRLPPAFNYTSAVTVGDVDGDGDLDIAFGNRDYGGVRDELLLNGGSGTFSNATQSRLPAALTTTTDITLLDVDRDNDLDLLVGTPEQIRLFPNDGTGIFGLGTNLTPPAIGATSGFAGADIDGDRDVDVVLANNGNGAGAANGVIHNLQQHLAAPRPAEVGSVYTLNIHSRTANTIAIPALSPAEANIRLPRFGVVGVDPSRLTVLTASPIVGTTTSASFAIPNDPALIGIRVHGQAVIVDPGGRFVALTNVTVDAIQR